MLIIKRLDALFQTDVTNKGITAEMNTAKSICNFRTQTTEDYQDWKWFVKWSREHGISTCRPLIAFIRSFRRSMEGLEHGLETKSKRELLNAFPLIIALDQQNTFVYSTERFRREPEPNLFLKNNFRTASMGSRMALSYVLEKARWMHRNGQGSFCYRDFAEMKHGFFRKIVLKLRRSNELITVDPRSCPRFYMLMQPTEEA